MFETLLIANRGEIACRIMRTAQQMGIHCIAVYSEADADALHVKIADEAHPIGPAAARESYLVPEKILEVAKRSGAQAIHPGYGFLSENADFAEACAEAGVVFIGPSANAIRAMGSKSEAKALMEKANVPLVPGYHGAQQDPEFLKQQAEKVGFPLLIKATAGGGGKGMRIVSQPEDFSDALAAAKREAANAFGDDRVLLERYLAVARHIEVQIFGDSHGHVVHLFERDCSIQRRLQKVVEEAPAPGLSPEHRSALGKAAVDAAKAIRYEGAGTVEFIMDAASDDAVGDFFFMEMNTRLQVEHPVTEAITDLDLVAWQLQVAAGEALPLAQKDLDAQGPLGHAIEVRLYAEDPLKDFLPAIGTLQSLRFPEASDHIRIDSGVSEGAVISPHYDPMIAKIIVHDQDRKAALRRLRYALQHCQIAGLTTNLLFLQTIANHEAFQKGAVDTGFITTYSADLQPKTEPASKRLLALACLRVLLDRQGEAQQQRAKTLDPHSPWLQADGWRLNDEGRSQLVLQEGEQTHHLLVQYNPGGQYKIHFPEGGSVLLAGQWLPGQASPQDVAAVIDGVYVKATLLRHGDDVMVIDGLEIKTMTLFDPLHADSGDDTAEGQLVAPMPGRVIALSVKEGDHVEAGQSLMILEAMKMEHNITAPMAGVVEKLYFQSGDQVEEGAELLRLKAEEGDAA